MSVALELSTVIFKISVDKEQKWPDIQIKVFQRPFLRISQNSGIGVYKMYYHNTKK